MLAKLHPQLRQHISIYSHVYRGERWYVLRDMSSGRHLRFSAPAYDFVARLDGEQSIGDIWNETLAKQGSDALSQGEIIQILTQLFTIDMLSSEMPHGAENFLKRFQNQHQHSRQRAVLNPLAIRVPLMDPDALLNTCMPWVRPLFSRAGVIIWLLVACVAGVLALSHHQALLAEVGKDVLLPTNLVMMLLAFIVIKTIHEFGHAFAVKMWGGEVHEMGITLLVLVPVPYMDASAASAFRSKYKRALISAVGVVAELFVAALALFVWLSVEPGMVKDLAFDALLISSVMTLLFNANPLLRFDGYYVLQDLIEIPNLYTRSGRYYLYLIQRYLFGITQARSPVTAHGEAPWFVVYGLAALIYRLVLLVMIALFLAEEYLFIGVALGAWAVASQLLLPLYRALRFFLVGPALTGQRFRAVSITVLVIGVLAAGLMLRPVSLSTKAEGVVWVSDQAQIYAGTEGVVAEVLVASGSRVEPGTPLVQLQAPSLDTEILKLQARQRELSVRSAAERIEQRVQSEITRIELHTVEAELALLKEQSAGLLLRSEVTGVFVVPEAHRFTGRYLRKGDLVGYVVSPERLIVRTIVPQSDIGLLRQQVARVEVRFAERLGESVTAHIIREIPAGNNLLPSRALGAAGGGNIAVRLNGDDGITAAEKVFQVDLGLPEDLVITGIGERAYVRFDHGSEPLVSQWIRSARQLLLSRLSF
ncbi:hypothetical protein [Aliamphritea ceti]|uniref:hypothetical protein n=1 Tax=Aliamphritea ceti TaxID=1524258 RepID=UPI0021C4358C|nr:hypothetical protein [Aliamphritea ceti]